MNPPNKPPTLSCTVLTTRGIEFPLVSHKALMVQTATGPVVYHHTKSKGPRAEPLGAFLRAGREIIRIERTAIDGARLERTHNELKHLHYEALNFNCEHYVNLVLRDRWHSPQVGFWMKAAAALVLIAGIFLIFRR